MIYKTICFRIDRKTELPDLGDKFVCERWADYFLVYKETTLGRSGSMVSVIDFNSNYKTINQIREEKISVLLDA